MRQRSGSVICGSCRRLIHVSERRCPHCGAVAPSLFGFAPQLRKLFGDNGQMTGLIVGFCVVMYAASVLIDFKGLLLQAEMRGGGLLSMGSPSQAALYVLGMTGGGAWANGQWWTLLTANYLHGSLIHILFNMMWTRQLGPSVSQQYGPARFFILWTLSGVAGFLVSNLFSGAPTIGASASVFGLMGALAAFGRRRGGSSGAQLSRQMWVWAIAMFLFSFVMPGINNWAHGGGFAGGLALGMLLPLKGRTGESNGVQLVALLLLLATLGAFGAAVYSNLSLLLR